MVSQVSVDRAQVGGRLIVKLARLVSTGGVAGVMRFHFQRVALEGRVFIHRRGYRKWIHVGVEIPGGQVLMLGSDGRDRTGSVAFRALRGLVFDLCDLLASLRAGRKRRGSRISL